jgi:hypothetical protein
LAISALTMADSQNVQIESITCTHKDIDYFILDRLLDRMPPISSLTGPAPQKQVLGSLAILPIELLLMILDNLAVTDVMRFRRSNRFAMHVVDTASALRSSLQFAPNTVKGMMAIRASAHITSQQLRNKVLQRDCDNTITRYVGEEDAGAWHKSRCGQLAQHIYLPTCMRLCFRCVTEYPKVLDADEIAMCCNIEPEDLLWLPAFALCQSP